MVSSEADSEAARRVKQALAEAPLTQAEVARRINASESTISRVKNAKVPLTKAMARRLASVLPVSARFLLYGEQQEPHAQPARTQESAGVYRAPVIRRDAYHCPNCRQEVAPGADTCPHCGAGLLWPGRETRG
ncbi:MAG: helix-turn-helix domain-containing protein [Candidatus Brocadiia bacterium]